MFYITHKPRDGAGCIKKEGGITCKVKHTATRYRRDTLNATARKGVDARETPPTATLLWPETVSVQAVAQSKRGRHTTQPTRYVGADGGGMVVGGP